MADEVDGERPREEPLQAGTHAICPVVGIGASAGGVEALKRLLPNLDPESGMAFVVVQHLDPDHGSVLAEILAGSSPIPVSQITGDVAVEPGHVYVIPPNATLTISQGRLLLARPAPSPRHRNAIDEFFTSLARDQGGNAACIILSGTGTDGTLGLRAIKENGGLTLAQSGAEYDGMMRSAVATGLVDFVLRAEDMPERLSAFFRHVTDSGDDPENVERQPDATDYLGQITALLRTQTGHDFGSYKDRTIVRRIQRRMHLLQIDTVPDFVERLRRDSREVNLLFQDLLIGVTDFFRDPDSFAALEHAVMPSLFKDKGADDTVRVWVPGCATGEEAYSLAILLNDYAAQSRPSPSLQIFATDIDEHALATARTGRYSAGVLKNVSERHLERYFVREDGTYRVANELREICLFSPHNLLRDAPFSRLDLISCRNLLIYFSADLQDRVIPLFHYALAPNGYLFLGTSENVTRHGRLFTTVDKTHRIFRRRTLLERRIPDFPLTSPPSLQRPPHGSPSLTVPVELNLKSLAERQVLDRFTPAYVVINAEGDLLLSSSRTGKYIEMPAGTPNTNIFNMARPGLRLELRTALHRAIASGQPATQARMALGTNGGRQEIDLFIQPLQHEPHAETFYMVVFQDLGTIQPIADGESAPGDEAEAASVRHLDAELRATKDRLQTVTEELESSNEELKSGNEELQSMNEELQSANEELETSREELQSINEELQTVNAELNTRVEELTRTNNDMTNLLESTQIATVFLDRTLAIKSFTPAAKDVFRLVDSDSGRPLSHVRQRFDYDTMQQDAERVLRTLATVERPVSSSEDGTRYMLRMLPYRTVENVINGVVMTFTDITRITAAEARIQELTQALQARVDELETILDLVPVGVMIADEEGTTDVMINVHGARLLGLTASHRGLLPVAAPFRLLGEDGELPPDQQPLRRVARTGESVTGWQGRLENDHGGSTEVMVSAIPLFNESGGVRGAVAAIVDISRHKGAEAQQRFLLAELQHRVKNILATISSLATRMSGSHMSTAEFQAAFVARIGAMSRTHSLLTEGAWSGTTMRALAELAVGPYVGTAMDTVRADGPEVGVSAPDATTLGMILHELATNAAKYGALSADGGHVDLSWQQIDAAGSEGPRLRLLWTERGGPPVDASRPPGFGMGFITRAVTYELAGTADLELAPEGLRCSIEFPLSEAPATTVAADRHES